MPNSYTQVDRPVCTRLLAANMHSRAEIHQHIKHKNPTGTHRADAMRIAAAE